MSSVAIDPSEAPNTKNKDGLIYDSERQVLILAFGVDYEVDLDRISTERDLLAWVCHLCEKSWMDKSRVRDFAIRVCNIKGFNPYGL